jgi:hypothetical protein
MTKGWEFYWEGQRCCVGAPEAASARQFLRKQYPHVAQRARFPRQLAKVIVLGLQLEDGVIRVMNGKIGQ